MGIGTSLGAHFEDDFDLQAGKEYTPPEIKPKNELIDSNVVTPNQAQQDKQLNDVEQRELGGTPISMRIYPQKEPEIENREDENVVTPDSRGREWLNRAVEPYEAAMTTPHTPMSEALGSRDIPLPVFGKTHPSNYVDPDFYETQLDEESNVQGTEADFQKWKAEMAPKDSGEDYDYRGAFMSNVKPDPDTGHWPDKFKKPNHPTFSDQSKYAKDRPELAGSWDGDRYIPPVGKPLIPDGGQVSEGNNGLNAIFGTGDVERFKLWPERALRDLINAAHKVATGQIGMWSFNDNTGEFHTSIEGMEASHAMMAGVLSGTVPGRISLRSPGATGRVDLPPVTEENNTALREALNRIRRQPSNIQADTPVSPRQPVTRRAGEDDTSFALRTIEDVLSRPEETPGTPEFNTRYGYPENTGSQRLVNEEHELNIQGYVDELYSIRNEHEDAGHGEWNPHGIRPGESYEAFARRNVDQPTRADFEQQPFNHDDVQSWMEERAEVNKAKVESIKKIFEENKEVVKTKGTISMMKNPEVNPTDTNRHFFKFISKDGAPGDMDILLRNNGKDLHVSWIGGVGGNRANDIGKSEMKNLFKLLADEFPKGEYVTGFRVSGARSRVGKIGDAEMRIPGRGKTSE